MAKFRYSLQSVLNIKLKMETQAKQEFSAAKGRLDEEEAKLAALLRRKEGYEQEGARLRQGVLKLLDLEENKNAIAVMEQLAGEQREQVELARKRLEQAREKMADAMKDRKTYEKLREKAFEEYRLEENRQEGKAVDELVSYTYAEGSR